MDFLMHRDVFFPSKGLRCSGRFFMPVATEKPAPRDPVPGGSGPYRPVSAPVAGNAATAGLPAIVMAPGFSAIKEQGLLAQAERFAAAGFAALAFDYRFFGESEGEPRNQLFPLEQSEDYRGAVSWLSAQPEVDPARIGIWGTSYGGGIALHAASMDRRIKAVVAQVPSVLTPAIRRAMNPGTWQAMEELLARGREERRKTGTVNYIKVVAPEGEPCALPGNEAYRSYMSIAHLGRNWRNEITLESLEKIFEFDPAEMIQMIQMIAPAALLIIAAEKDTLVPLDAVKAAFARAREPKNLTTYPINHFDIYTEPWMTRATEAAVEWFRRYL